MTPESYTHNNPLHSFTQVWPVFRPSSRRWSVLPKVCCLGCSKRITSDPSTKCVTKRGKKSCSYCRTKDAECRPVPRRFRDMGAEAAEIRLRLRSVPSNPAKDYLAGFLGNRQKNNAAKASLANLQQRYIARVKKYMRNHRMNDANLGRAQLQAMIRIGDMLEKIVGALMSANNVESILNPEWSEEETEMSEDEVEPDVPVTIKGD